MICFGDFETRSKIDLRVAGVYKYAEDLSTRVLFFAWSYEGKKKIYSWDFRNPYIPKKLFQYIRNGGIFEAHNAEFELEIWNTVWQRDFQKLFPKTDFPELKLEQIRCSEAMAAVLTLPRALEKLAESLDTKVKKDMEGRRKMLAVSKPRKPSKNNPSIWNDKKMDLDITQKYNVNDVAVEKACSKKLLPLSENELAIFHHTLKINKRGLPIDVKACQLALKFAKRFELEQKEKLHNLTGGQVKAAKQYSALKKYLWSVGFETPNVQQKTLEDALKTKLKSQVKDILETVLSINKSSISKYKAFLASVCSDGKIRGYLRYHAATTGRFGGKYVQPHNLFKSLSGEDENIIATLKQDDYEFFKTLYPNVFAALADCLRGMIIAPPGQKLFDADYSAIEARIVLWFAKDEKALEGYRRGEDAYKKIASLIFGIPIDEVTPAQRDLGKRCELGSGFGMGHVKFQATCEKFNQPISEALAKKAINTYRALHAPVKKFWYALEAAAIRAVKQPGQVVTISYLQWRYDVEKNVLACKLPSGKKIYYQKPKISQTLTRFGMREQLSYTMYKGKTPMRVRTYGGHLTENVVQATARELMCFAALNLEALGYQICLSVHDELLAFVNEKSNFDTFLHEVNKLPLYLTGLPLKTGGWSGYRYRK